MRRHQLCRNGFRGRLHPPQGKPAAEPGDPLGDELGAPRGVDRRQLLSELGHLHGDLHFAEVNELIAC